MLCQRQGSKLKPEECAYGGLIAKLAWCSLGCIKDGVRGSHQMCPTFLALVANLRVLWVSSAWLEAGVMLHTTATRAPFPVKLACTIDS